MYFTLGQPPVHNHLAPATRNHHNNALSQMRALARNDPTVPARRVYQQVLLENNRAANAAAAPVPEMPAFSSVVSGINRTRAEQRPPVPADLANVVSYSLSCILRCFHR